MIPHDAHLHIGSLLGPFEVLSRIPNATYRIYGKTMTPVRDVKALRLSADATLGDAPPLDVLHVPGGSGQEALMEDGEALGWIRQQASGACSIFSVCTGALISGAAGLLKGRRATTHWSALHLLPFLRGDATAQAIQLQMVYAPEPPFDSGTPETAPAAISDEARRSAQQITARREQTARRLAAKLGIAVQVAGA